MSSKSGFNFFRKIWHILGLLIPLILFLDPFQGMFGLVYPTRAVLVASLGGFFLLLIIVEVSRLTIPAFEKFFYKYFGFLMKESERKRLNGTVPYFLANLIVVLFFPPEIAILAVLFLVVGDPVAAYVGSKYGKTRFYNGKSREGILGFLIPTFLVSIFVTYLITQSQPGSFFAIHHMGSIVWEIPLILGVSVGIACLVEFFASTTFYGLLDDNLFIPLAGAISLSVLSILFLDHTPMSFFFNPMDLLLQK